jgi:hypothetical protein
MPRARRQPQPGRRPDARRNHVPLVRTRPHAAAVRHGPAHCRRKQEGATQFPTIGLFERNANNFKGTRNTKAQKSWSSRAEPEVRIHLPPADSLSLSRSRFRRSRTRLSARVWAAGLAIGSAETLGFFDIAPIGGNISVGPNSSTAVRLMWWRDCHAGPNEVGPSLTYGRSLNPDWAQAKPSTIR